ncbi:MAG TPA: flagellar biosynthetic protein FliR [Deltaproteobacteria bacterium]|jgi:flagellar biosynthetic protein FliR|nr:flagellar biosynthetic protein FliR [Deltaproteobacteria bacterium]
MLSFDVNISDLSILLSILLRISIILFMLPIFNSGGVPTAVKALIVISFSVMLFPVIKQNIKPVPLEPASLVSVIIGELIYGTLFALSMLLIISAFQLAGELIGFEMGFGFSQTADPLTGARFTVLSVWCQLLATMIFLSINGHRIILRTLIESFKTIPIGSFALDSGLFAKMLLLSGMLFILAVKLAAPILAVLILTQVGLGLMAKFAPQMNILATSFPLTITLGVFFLGLTLIFWGEMGVQSFTGLFHFLENFSK